MSDFLETTSQQTSRRVDSYRRREVTLILLNICVVAALFFVHVAFLGQIGRPSAALLGILSGRFILLVLELLWLQRLDESSGVHWIVLHGHAAIALNIVFAFAASLFSGIADSHYSVLMIIPIIQAAFRFGLAGTMAIASLAITLTFVELWAYFYRRPPVDYGEFFEAATVSLIFFVVGFVVHLLAGGLREEEAKLQASMEELRSTQARLVAEEKMAAVGQLSSSIAHEIRNPVAMIASSLEVAAREPVGTTLHSEMMSIAAVESRRLETLTDDFLAFARRREPKLGCELIRDNLEYVASLAKARLVERDATVAIDCESDLSAFFDAGQMRQALLNLVLNAVDAMPERAGRILLAATSADRELVIAVENDGDMIAETARLFEPFYTTKPRGTGLGLAIVRSIARAHGGECRLAANEPGKVRFEISVPLPQGEETIDHVQDPNHR